MCTCIHCLADEVIKVTNAFSLRFPTHSFDSHLAAIQPKRLQDPAIAAEVARMYGELGFMPSVMSWIDAVSGQLLVERAHNRRATLGPEIVELALKAWAGMSGRRWHARVWF